MSNSTKNKHLSLEDRNLIQDCLHFGLSFKDIAKKINKDPTTVSKEIKLHSFYSNHSTKKDSNGFPIPCPLLSKPPFVCNSCPKCSYSCGFQKRKYYASTAHKQYLSTLKSSRSSIALNKQQFYDDDEIISSAIAKGQHLYHIVKTNNLNASLSSIFRYFNSGFLSASAIDLPRKVKFRKRKCVQQEYVPSKLKLNRTFEDFTNFINNNNISHWVEMDTVIGRVGGKTILTLNFTFCNLIWGILLQNKTASEVSLKIKELKRILDVSGFSFGEIFPIILTDNGGEFSNIQSIENDLFGNKETCLFFCDPFKSCQKPHVENSHTQLRNILPKHTSFDDLTQKDLNLIFSHINSAKKKSLNGKSAYEMFTFMYGKKLADTLGLVEIAPNEVIQNKQLLKQLKK